MNGELPGDVDTPITTLAGIFSLSDLLPQLPLPTVQPETLVNRSLLFHPRVSEEAGRLLNCASHALLPQLASALQLTDTSDIELKEYAGAAGGGGVGAQQAADTTSPQLLSALCQLDSHLFVGDAINCHTQLPSAAPPAPTPTPPPPPTAAAAPLAAAAVGVNSRNPQSIPCHTPQQSQQLPSPAAAAAAARVCNTAGGQANCLVATAAHSTPHSSAPSADALRCSVATRDLKVVVKSDPENELLMQRALADLQRRRSSSVSAEASGAAGLKTDPDADHHPATNHHQPPADPDQPDDDDDADYQQPSDSRNKYFRDKQRQRDQLKQKEREDRKRKRHATSDSGVSSGAGGGGSAATTCAGDDQFDIVSDAKRIKREEELLERIRSVKRYERRRSHAAASDRVSSDELMMQSSVVAKFRQALELVLDGTDELDINNNDNDDDDDDADVPQEALIPRYRLAELAAGAAQLRRLALTHTLPAELLVRALALLELNVRDAARVAPLAAAAGGDDADGDTDGCRLWAEIAMERVTRGADASLVIMYVLTAPGMPKRVYLEDCIDRVVKFVKYQLENTIFPAFDPVYRAPSKKSVSAVTGGRGRKRGSAGSSSAAAAGGGAAGGEWGGAMSCRDKSVLALYNRLRELVAALADLLHIQVLTDTSVLQLSSLGVAPFFVESISDLQLAALRLVTTVFSRYPKHRRLLLDDILASIARLPSSKRSLRTYRLSALAGGGGGDSGGRTGGGATSGGAVGGATGDEHEQVYIQMLTALVLQLIQCVVTLPNYLGVKKPPAAAAAAAGALEGGGTEDGDDDTDLASSSVKQEEPDAEIEVDRDVLIVDRYDTALRTAHSFLSVFLQKCGSRNEEIDYRPLFENFVQDLLVAVNRPEWPAAECLLSLLGTLLVSNFSNRSTDMALRVSSLDYLGVVAARLRRDAVQTVTRPHLIDSIVSEVRREEQRLACADDAPATAAPPPAAVLSSGSGSGKKKDKKKKKKQDGVGESADQVSVCAAAGSQQLQPWQLVVQAEEERTRFLQRLLLDYLAVCADCDDTALLHCRHFYLAQWYREAPQEIRRACHLARGPSAPAGTANSRHRKHDKEHDQRKQQQQRRRQQRKQRQGGGRRRGSSTGDSDSHQSASDSDQLSGDDQQQDEAGDADDEQSEQLRQAYVNTLVEVRRQFLLTKVNVAGDQAGRSAAAAAGAAVNGLTTCLDYDHAELITKYLASKRPFSHSFDLYLKQMIHVLSESGIAVRTKAMKCLTMVVEADPAVLARRDMQMGVHNSFLDHSTAVREAAVDLVGKFLLCRPELIDSYYDMLSSRILDTGVSVRKRVIKIMKDICVECPNFTKIPEICVKMIRRINDEEGIRKLVMEVFQAMWFTPVKESECAEAALLVKVMNITDVVVACRDSGLDWFEQLLNTLFKPKEDREDSTRVVSEPPRQLLLASRQIVDCLVRHILRLEEQSQSPPPPDTPAAAANHSESGGGGGGSSQRLVACLNTLYLFARIRPALLVPHATTLQPYLAVRCHTRADYMVISHVARTLQLVVPLVEHPSETFLAQLEEDSVKLILQHDRVVVESCIACLASIVNRVTHNYQLVRDCFRKYYTTMKRYREKHEEDADAPALLKCKPFFRRSLFTVGLLLRHFDFKSASVHADLGESVVGDVYELLMYFLELPVSCSGGDLHYFTLQALGFVAVRHYELLLLPRTKALYERLLTTSLCPSSSSFSSASGCQESSPVSAAEAAVGRQIRAQVLLNLEVYLVEEEQRMIRQDEDWSKRAKDENLKEMGDVTSGMASTVIQLYLNRVLQAFLDSAVPVRYASLKVIQLILSQGLVHPVQIVPYLICMSTDPDERISHTADRQLHDIEKKYPGFIQMKASVGIRYSFQLQTIIQRDTPTRGLKFRDNEPPAALNGFLYTLLRTTKQQRRAFAMSCLRNFDEHVKNSLTMMLYLADNLACFPYQVADEVLFIIHQVDVIVSVTGSTVLQCVREALLPPAGQVARYQPDTGALLAYEDEDEEDVQQLLQRLPADSGPVRHALLASQGCQLLLSLKLHLKEFYGLSDNKIAQYSPSEAGKVYEKTINRRSSAPFEPRVTIDALRCQQQQQCDDQHETEEARVKLVTQYLEFKQLMLHIDPADDDDDEGAAERPPVSAGAAPASTALGLYRTRAASSGASAGAGDTEQQQQQQPAGGSVTPSAGHREQQPPQQSPQQQQQQPRPPITLSLSALSKQAAAAATDTGADAQAETLRVPKLTIVPLRFPGDESRAHHKSHKHKKSDRHKKKKKKRKRHSSGADDDEPDSDAASDPDYAG